METINYFQRTFALQQFLMFGIVIILGACAFVYIWHRINLENKELAQKEKENDTKKEKEDPIVAPVASNSDDEEAIHMKDTLKKKIDAAYKETKVETKEDKEEIIDNASKSSTKSKTAAKKKSEEIAKDAENVTEVFGDTKDEEKTNVPVSPSTHILPKPTKKTTTSSNSKVVSKPKEETPVENTNGCWLG